VPDPVGTLSTTRSPVTSTSATDTPASVACRPAPGPDSTTRPTPPATENVDAVPTNDHGPPTSAAPQPPLTDRPNPSCATTDADGAVTVTVCVVVAVAASSSVTVRATV
jgi:hypothetical protein